MTSQELSAIQSKQVDLPKQYSKKEELANGVSHGLGIAAGILALIFSVNKGFEHLSITQLTGVIVYCCSIILLFLCSTLYHSVSDPRLKHKLKIADHCAIYLLIAGTYTPLMLIEFSGDKASIMLAAIWGIALGGVLFKTIFIHRFKVFSLVLYLTMGWLCMLVLEDLIAAMTPLGFQLLLLGGLFYSVGVIFYVVKRIPYNHAIWHLFVLAGALSHFLCVYLTVI
ncbi:PAQR family membrane homeostasis protein TrhA [Shewanella psychrotolerans]|uniref:PAQR family membrane homeostasis protein TrhA n=1 Tax=Shewanella psychrotolerans TaxID=2864206 RepID=UPI001C6614CC|nr:hemolysin III family protein [Shewanella psychrotolerans]QYJ99951.1 hemolysin III family protein [Shewanella psychrotolerans]